MTSSFAVNDKVWFRGKYASDHTIRGVVECLEDDRIGVRLENGNFHWAMPSQLQVRNGGGW